RHAHADRMAERPEPRERGEHGAIPLMPGDGLIPEEPDARIDGDPRWVHTGRAREPETLRELIVHVLDRAVTSGSGTLPGHHDEPSSRPGHEAGDLWISGQPGDVIDDACTGIESRPRRKRPARVSRDGTIERAREKIDGPGEAIGLLALCDAGGQVRGR